VTQDAVHGPHEHGAVPQPRYAEGSFATAAHLFRAAGDLERLRLLALLDGAERCVTELAEAVDATLSTVSQRLRVLRAEGLLARRREGKHIYYSLADGHVADLIRSALEHAEEERTPRAR
jgi:DNA-binding transcriptional ArsR family regulator